MKILAFIIYSFSVLTACSKNSMDTTNTPITTQPVNTPVQSADSLSYLALGDSYTIGESVLASENFPHQLVQSLRTSGYPNVAQPLIIARTGWRTDELIAAIKKANLTRHYDVVTLLIGVNNQFQGKSQDTYRTEFVQLLNTAIALANGNIKHVFVLSIPDYGVTPFAATRDRAQIAKQIDEFNAIDKEETLKAGVSYTDITPISREAAYEADLVANDGLHPSGIMYGRWVSVMLPAVLNGLKK